MYYCVDCGYLDTRICNVGRYRCDRKYEYHYADDLECYSFCHHKYSSDDVIRYRSESVKKSVINDSKSYRDGGCYITTMLVNILNLNDDDMIMDTMRYFRSGVLQKDNKYARLLFEYDFLGPRIATALANDKNNVMVSKKMFKNFITPIILDIDGKKYEDAIVKYANMTEVLRLYYGIEEVDEYSYFDVNDIDKMGYGKIRKYIKF